MEVENLKNKDEIAQIVARVHSENKTIVFTNGCFDLLHSGHVDLLEKSKGLGDVLIVGLNTDASVVRVKGVERPINAQGDRARVLRIRAMFKQAKNSDSMGSFPPAAIKYALRVEDKDSQRIVSELIGNAYESLNMIEAAAEAYRGILK